MQYLASYSSMQGWLRRNATTVDGTLDLRYDDLQDLIRHILVAVPVDEARYLEAYAGVARSIADGVFRSATHHFVVHGYFEGREAFSPERDGQPSLPPFVALTSGFRVRPRNGTLYVDMTFDELRVLLRRLVAAVPVDAEWYCMRYPHVAQAIASGEVASAAEHFVSIGYFESYWPFPMRVDVDWYFARYPDVRVEMEKGFGQTADEHFVMRGYGQSRLPSDSWVGLLWDKLFAAKSLRAG